MNETSPAARAAESRGRFSLDAAGFAVSGRTLLAPLTLDLPAGRVIGLLGQNGSGKSTFLKLLVRQEKPTCGTIRFEGEPLDAWGERAFARRVAYLPQDTPAAAGLKARELVALGRYPWHGALGRFSEIDRAKVTQAMALTFTAGLAERAVDSLSGGERQRVWLAMLVAQDAACLLLDEPISALDIAHQIEVLSLVRDLSRTRGTGVVVVLHDVNMAARFCDEIMALKDGRLVARDTPDGFMAAGPLRDVYGIDMAIVPHPGTGSPIAMPG